MSTNGREPDRGIIRPEDREAFKKRALELGSRLEKVQAKRVPQDDKSRGAAYGQAFKIAAELLAGLLVGGLIGWVLDRQFGTKPWLLVLFIILGFAAGMLNVIRTAQKMQATAEPLQRSAPSSHDDEEDDR
jgi:ATP synthase protein I